MIEVVAMKPEHLDELANAGCLRFLSYVNKEGLIELSEKHYSFTALLDGQVVACAGIVMFWQNRGEAWAVLRKGYTKHFLEIHKKVKRFLDLCNVRRVEATVEADFERGHRWMRLLGFELECQRMRQYHIDGTDAVRYVRLR